MKRGYRYRLLPKRLQKSEINQTIGNARKMYNLMLADRITEYELNGTSKTKAPSYFKNQEQYGYLNSTDSLAYANEWTNLNNAFSRFFESEKHGGDVGFPKFKCKSTDEWSYTTNNQHGSIRIEGKKIKLPKIGWVNIILHRPLPEGAVIKSVTVTRTRTDKYYVTLLLDFECEVPYILLNPYMSIGLDYSSFNLYVDSQGNTPNNPHYYRTNEGRLRRAQKSLSRKVKGSRNRQKARLRLARVHEDIANSRADYLWKLAVQIASIEDVHIVFIEDLSMQDIADRDSQYKLGKSTYDNGWYMFTQMLKQELEQRGKLLFKINKWYPTSQTCSNCGERYPEMKDLSKRVFVCEKCGLELDRDVNAAINIQKQGILEYTNELYAHPLKTVNRGNHGDSLTTLVRVLMKEAPPLVGWVVHYTDYAFGSFSSDWRIAEAFSHRYNKRDTIILVRPIHFGETALYVDDTEREWLLPENIGYVFEKLRIMPNLFGGLRKVYYIRRAY